MFISYVDHIIHQARVTSIIDRIGDETRHEIQARYPAAAEAPEAVTGEVPDDEPDFVIRSPGNGVILEIDVPALLDAIRRSDVLVVMVPAVGDFIPTVADCSRCTARGTSIPSGWRADETGTPRLRVQAPTWELYVALAFGEIRHHGAGTLQVMRRLRSAVEDLMGELPEHRHPALQRQVRMLDETVEWAFGSELERAAAVCPDAQGIGSGGGFDATQESEQADEEPG